MNNVLVDDIDVHDASQKRSPDAPVSYPFLWDAPHHDFVQWNGFGANNVMGSEALGGLARNVGEVLGVFGEVHVSKPNTALALVGYKSSARMPDLLHLENLVRKLHSPQWPKEFPAIDEPSARPARNCSRRIANGVTSRSIAPTPIGGSKRCSCRSSRSARTRGWHELCHPARENGPGRTPPDAVHGRRPLRQRSPGRRHPAAHNRRRDPQHADQPPRKRPHARPAQAQARRPGGEANLLVYRPGRSTASGPPPRICTTARCRASIKCCCRPRNG